MRSWLALGRLPTSVEPVARRQLGLHDADAVAPAGAALDEGPHDRRPGMEGEHGGADLGGREPAEERHQRALTAPARLVDQKRQQSPAAERADETPRHAGVVAKQGLGTRLLDNVVTSYHLTVASIRLVGQHKTVLLLPACTLAAVAVLVVAPLMLLVRGVEHHPDVTRLGLDDERTEQLFADCSRLVDNYQRMEDPTAVQAIGLELSLSAQIDGLALRGIIDRLELRNGELVVTDYKTGRVPSETFEAQSLGGVHTYALLCEQMFGRRPARVQLLYLSKPEAIIATPTEQSVRGVARKTTALWTAIERACARDDFRPHPSRLCEFCSFKPYCPSFGGDPEQAAELHGPGTVIEPALPLASA